MWFFFQRKTKYQNILFFNLVTDTRKVKCAISAEKGNVHRATTRNGYISRVELKLHDNYSNRIKYT